MEFFIKHKIIITRSLGIVFLLFAFMAYFWVTPQKGYSENDRAAANVARMEAKVAGTSSKQAPKQNDSKFLQELKKTQEKQLKFLIILMVVLGIGSLGYSFLKKPQEDKS